MLFTQVRKLFLPVLAVGAVWNEFADGAETKVLENDSDLQKMTNGKRVMHVKGFGGGLGWLDTNTGEFEKADSKVELTKDEIFLQAKKIAAFSPDYLVVDGDPFKTIEKDGKDKTNGFQIFIQAYADQQKKDNKKSADLIWVKDIKKLPQEGEEKYDEGIAKAEKWAVNTELNVFVLFVQESSMYDKLVDKLFGEGAWDKIKARKYNERNVLRLGDMSPDEVPKWYTNMSDVMKTEIEKIENREENKGFEVCSFTNSAKGNYIYDLFRNGDDEKPANQSVISFGGAESVLLEYASLYDNSTSGFQKGMAELVPIVRGQKDDPTLPTIKGDFVNGPNNPDNYFGLKIALAVIGGVLGLAFIGLLVFCLVKGNKKKGNMENKDLKEDNYNIKEENDDLLNAEAEEVKI